MTYPEDNRYERGITAMTSPGQADGQAVRRMFISQTTCLHGIDPRRVMMRRDTTHNALWVEVTGVNTSIRIDLANNQETLRRDRDGLLRLAEIAVEAANEVNELMAVTA